MTATSSLIASLTGLSLLVSPVNEVYCQKTCALSDNGYALIRTFEGYSPYVYKDSAGLPTIGYGHLIVKGDKFNEPLMPEAAHALLVKDTAKAVNGLNKNVNVKLKQNQADSVISFTYNVGVGALQKSTLLKKINAEKHSEVPQEFLKWIRAAGKIIKGLVNRRTAEAELYKQ